MVDPKSHTRPQKTIRATYDESPLTDHITYDKPTRDTAHDTQTKPHNRLRIQPSRAH
jgi:hypothetical protein